MLLRYNLIKQGFFTPCTATLERHFYSLRQNLMTLLTVSFYVFDCVFNLLVGLGPRGLIKKSKILQTADRILRL